MSARLTNRQMTGRPCAAVEVRIGYNPSGQPVAAIDASKYRAIALPFDNADMVRNLILDLEEAVIHLEGGTRD